MLYVMIVGTLLGYIQCVENSHLSQDIQELFVQFRRLQDEVVKMNNRLEVTENENLCLRNQLNMTTTEIRKKLSNLETEFILTQKNKLVDDEIHNPDSINKRFLLPGGLNTSNTSHRIAFSASLTRSVSLGHLQTINYDNVITNLGNAYDPADGHFVAPVRGLYILMTHLLNEQNNEVDLEMVRNGVRLVTMFLDPHGYNMASQAVIVVLEQGDKIWIRRFTEQGFGAVYGKVNDPYSTFSGVLLYEM